MALTDDQVDHVAKRLANMMTNATAEVMKMTANHWGLYTGCEAFLSGLVAQQMFHERLLIGRSYVRKVGIEVDVREFMPENAEEEVRGTGRMDVVGYDEDHQPLIAVELKKYSSPSVIEADIRRLSAALRGPRTSLQAGVMLVARTERDSTAQKVTRSLDQLLEDIEEGVREKHGATWGGYDQRDIATTPAEREPGQSSGLRAVQAFAIVLRK